MDIRSKLLSKAHVIYMALYFRPLTSHPMSQYYNVSPLNTDKLFDVNAHYSWCSTRLPTSVSFKVLLRHHLLQVLLH